MLDRSTNGGRVIAALAGAIEGTTTPGHLDRLIDLVGEIVPHDLVTVTRYSVTDRPAFVSHRRYSDAMIRRYLDVYYAYDPFCAFWRRERRPGIVPLLRLADKHVKDGRYMAEFLKQSVICDEVGVLVPDGDGCCLGLFLERADRRFTRTEVASLEATFPILAALHALQRRSRTGTEAVQGLGSSPHQEGPIGEHGPSADSWLELSAREREVATLILAGHPNAGIARRLGIAVGTVKNHRHSIYAKLDITTEREMFLQSSRFRSTSPSSADG